MADQALLDKPAVDESEWEIRPGEQSFPNPLAIYGKVTETLKHVLRGNGQSSYTGFGKIVSKFGEKKYRRKRFGKHK